MASDKSYVTKKMKEKQISHRYLCNRLRILGLLSDLSPKITCFATIHVKIEMEHEPNIGLVK